MKNAYRLHVRLVTVAAAALGLPAMAAGKDIQVSAIRDVIDCQKVPEAPARLSCFERAVTALAAATSQGDVVVLDREAVKKTRRELFGFSVSTADLFDGPRGKGDKQSEELDEIATTIAAVSQNRAGDYVLTLAQGGRWEQISTGSFGRAPRAGMKVEVRRAAFGSYKMKIGDAPAIKVRRIG